jgi:hypothetical protein
VVARRRVIEFISCAGFGVLPVEGSRIREFAAGQKGYVYDPIIELSLAGDS